MKILVGPMEASASASASSPAFASSSGVPASSSSSSSCLFLNGDEGANDVVGGRNTFRSDDSSESSSIGAPGDSDDEEDDVSNVGLPRNKLSMDSLEDSLPSKRGLSNHYNGKSKSFGNLKEAMSMKDLQKEENPFNKRRRVLIANKWSRKFFYSRQNPKSMPLLPILPDHVDEEQQQNSDDDQDQHQVIMTSKQQQEDQRLHVNKLKVKMGFKSQSCFCLADLAEVEEGEEDEDD